MSSALQRQYLLTLGFAWQLWVNCLYKISDDIVLTSDIVLSCGRCKPISRCYRPGYDDPDSLCVIGQGGPSRPMICLRCRTAYLRMFFTTIVAMVSEAFKQGLDFQRQYILLQNIVSIS